MARLTLENVSKLFHDTDGREVVALDEIDLTVNDGEFLVLVGPSGCGKSTTLRTIAGLEPITSGEIRLDGQRINDQPPADRDIAMVFQSYALYPHMTVRENMRFGLEESTELADDRIDEIVETTAAKMDITELLDRKPDELSGGQQQRVALGRAIVRDPEAFLMDEPLSNLDANLRATMRTEIQRLQADLGVTTVYVTHDQTEAMTMGDRIAILNDGVLQQVGTPLECYHEPDNLFVANFVGEPSMRTFEMTVDGDTLRGAAFDYQLTDRTRSAVQGTTAVTLGIRPEDVALSPENASDEHSFDCRVDVVEPMGDTNIVYLTRADRSVSAQQLIATVGGTRRIQPDDRVVAHLPEDAIHLFDTATGTALKNRSATPN